MGEKFPLGASPHYHPRDWKCPQCHKYHSVPHWKDERQESGFVKEEAMDSRGCSSVSGPDHKLTVDGIPAPLFCPHCGWVMKMDTIVKIPKRRFTLRKHDN